MGHYDIAILLGYPEISGGTNVIMEHALGLTRLGHGVTIVTELPFDSSRLAWKPQAADLPRRSHAECRGHTFDLCMATWWRSMYDLHAVDARRYAYFCQSIESRFFNPADADMKALVDYTYRQPIPIVTEASWIVEYLGENYGHEASLVRNGIDKSIFRPDGPAVAPRDPQRLRVLVEGALGVPFKRVDRAIELCRRAEVPELWLLTPSECKTYAGVERVFSRVPMRDVPAIYRSCDVLVKLSTVEGMFGPPLEMMHCGGTAITSAVTGHDEYMRHMHNGIVVPRDREIDVVRYLRRLRDDPHLLARLKQGAAATAASWPGWPEAVAEMDAFVRRVMEQPPDREQIQTYMRTHLRAALQLAGPLHRAVAEDYSARELAGRLRRKLAARARRELSGLFERLNGRVHSAAEPPAVSPLPELRSSQPLPHRARYVLCFAGPRRIYGLHACGDGPRMNASFVDIPAGPTAVDLKTIRELSPDLTIVFEPLRWEPEELLGVGGLVLGYGFDPLDPARLVDLTRRFPIDDPRVGLLVPSADDVGLLRAAGVRAIDALALPVDLPRCRAADEDPSVAWPRRPYELVALASPPPDLPPSLARFFEREDALIVRSLPAPGPLRALLHQTQTRVVWPGELELPPGHAAVVRDAAAGCLVIAPLGAAEEYGFMPGEHYVGYESLPRLADRLVDELRQPDRLAVIRRNGTRQAAHFDASAAYAALLDRLTRPLDLLVEEPV